MFFQRFIAKQKKKKEWDSILFRIVIGLITSSPLYFCFIGYSIYSNHGIDPIDVIVYFSFWIMFSLYFSIKER